MEGSWKTTAPGGTGKPFFRSLAKVAALPPMRFSSESLALAMSRNKGQATLLSLVSWIWEREESIVSMDLSLFLFLITLIFVPRKLLVARM